MQIQISDEWAYLESLEQQDLEIEKELEELLMKSKTTDKKFTNMEPPHDPMTKAEIAKVLAPLNEGSKDSEPIIESPSGVLDIDISKFPANPVLREILDKQAHDLKITVYSSKVSQLIRDISFLRERMIKDYNQIGLFLDELHRLIPNLKSADYYIQEGLDSLKTGVEILKDSEVKK